MTMADPSSVVDEVQALVTTAWDPSMTVRDWWQRLFDAGLSHPHWPEGLGGRGWSTTATRTALASLGSAGVVAPPTGHMGSTLAAPTILQHGTELQQRSLLPPIALGLVAWCQLFSEPSSGSDLASVGTRAVLDGDEWVVSGQKVWNSGADGADMGLLLARTHPELPKHRGISYLLVDMRAPGVEVRPLVTMAGSAAFCEVFLDEVRIARSDVLGAEGDGWSVAQTTLAAERAMVAGGGFPGLAQARSGACGDLDCRVDEIVARHRRSARADRLTGGAVPVQRMIEIARAHERDSDAVVRQALARYHSDVRVAGWLNRRVAAARGRLTGADGSLAKLATARICQASRDLSFSLMGPRATLAGGDSPMGGELVRVGLASPGTRIGGGTDEIQLNVLGERALGLPREPGGDTALAYRELEVGTRARQPSQR